MLIFNSSFSSEIRRKLFGRVLLSSKIQRTRIGLNFTRSYLLLVKSGLSTEESFEFLARSEKNKLISDRYLEAKELIESEEDFNMAFKLLDFMPESLSQILAVSTKTGHVEKSLEKVLRVLKRDLDSYIEKFISRIEPVMIFVVTLIVGLVLFSVVSPVFNMIGSMG